MATIIDMKTRSPIALDDNLAVLEILDWSDPILDGLNRDNRRVLIDGLVPVALAREIAGLCAAHNARLSK